TLVRGIFSLASASFEGWSKALGVIDIIFAIVMAVVLFSSPGAALMALVWIIGIYTIVFGAFLIIMAIMVRKQARRSLRGRARRPLPRGGHRHQRGAAGRADWEH